MVHMCLSIEFVWYMCQSIECVWYMCQRINCVWYMCLSIECVFYMRVQVLNVHLKIRIECMAVYIKQVNSKTKLCL